MSRLAEQIVPAATRHALWGLYSNKHRKETRMDPYLTENLWYSKDVASPRLLPQGYGWTRYYKQYKATIWQVDFQVLTTANGRRSVMRAEQPVPVAFLN